jgi:hypothetical protein
MNFALFVRERLHKIFMQHDRYIHVDCVQKKWKSAVSASCSAGGVGMVFIRFSEQAVY